MNHLMPSVPLVYLSVIVFLLLEFDSVGLSTLRAWSWSVGSRGDLLEAVEPIRVSRAFYSSIHSEMGNFEEN